MTAEKSLGRIFRELSFFRIVKRHIGAGSLRKVAQKRAFPHLTHACCQQYLEALTKRRDFFFDRSRKVHPALLATQAKTPPSELLPACISEFFLYYIRIFTIHMLEFSLHTCRNFSNIKNGQPGFPELTASLRLHSKRITEPFSRPQSLNP